MCHFCLGCAGASLCLPQMHTFPIMRQVASTDGLGRVGDTACTHAHIYTYTGISGHLTDRLCQSCFYCVSLPLSLSRSLSPFSLSVSPIRSNSECFRKKEIKRDGEKDVCVCVCVRVPAYVCICQVCVRACARQCMSSHSQLDRFLCSTAISHEES